MGLSFPEQVWPMEGGSCVLRRGPLVTDHSTPGEALFSSEPGQDKERQIPI